MRHPVVWLSILGTICLSGCGGSGGGAPSSDAGVESATDTAPDATDAAPDVTDAGPCPGKTSCGEGCVDTRTDPHNCGACGVQCAADEECSGGSCVCSGGRWRCGAAGDAGPAYCADVQTDEANCGSCGLRCAAGQVCLDGTCSDSCGYGRTICSQSEAGPRYCANLSRDAANCGSCGTACPPGQLCSAGTCAASCGAGLTTCGGDAGTSYCADVQTDNLNCGGCGKACGPTQTCVGATCQEVCPTGYLDCSGTSTGGCTVDGNTDPDHCGSCDHACSAGPSPACVGAVCSYTLATFGGLSSGLAISGNSLYWPDRNNGTIATVHTDGTGLGLLASYQVHPHAVATDGKNAYWATTTSIMETALDGSSGLGTLFNNFNLTVNDIATDGTYLYFTAGHGVDRVDVTGANLTALATGTLPYSIATDGVNVYWTDLSGAIMKASISGTNKVQLATAQQPMRIATDGKDVYWTDYTAGTVNKVAADGSSTTVTTLASGQDKPLGLATDGTQVFWSAGDSISRVGTDGTGLATVITHAAAAYIALDKQNVYWPDLGGSIRSTPR